MNIIQVLIQNAGIDFYTKLSNGSTVFHEAVRSMNLELVRNILSTNFDVNCADDFGCTALHIACQIGFIDCIKLLLLNEKIDVNLQQKNGKVPIHIAIETSNVEIVKLLLSDQRMNANIATNEGMTSLHFASLAGNVEMVELISNFPGMDLNAKNSISFSCCIKLKQMLYDETPLHLAVKNNHIDAAMLLASKEGIDLNAKDSVYSFIFMKEFFISYSSKSNASFNIQK